LAILMLAFTQPATAASKSEVGSAGCISLDKARAKHPTAHLRYRLIQSEKCWYDPVSLAKAGHKTRVAGEGAVPSTLAAGSLGATPSESVRGQPATRTYDNDDLNEIFTVLCGGPCPQLANPPGYLLRKK
jgi:hypothetical protein